MFIKGNNSNKTMSGSVQPQRLVIKPPEKGSFPIDHDGECKAFMKDYMQCLAKNKNDNFMCRTQSMHYLQCRMENNLMEHETVKNLGYGDLQ